jgi:hypothetical protein
MHNVVLRLVRRRHALRVFSDATFREKEANVGLAADMKLAGNASQSHELALLASRLGAEEALLLLGGRATYVRLCKGLVPSYKFAISGLLPPTPNPHR